MRPIVIASLNAAIAAMAASAALAAADKSSTWLRVQQLPLAGSMQLPGIGGGGWIEIQGWDWEVEASDNLYSFKTGAPSTGYEDFGARPNQVGVVTVPPIIGSTTKVDSFTMKQGHKKTRPVGTSDLTMKRGTSPSGGGTTVNQYAIIMGQAQAAPPPPPPPPRPDIVLDYDEGDTGTHAAPVPPNKFGRVKIKFAWPGCAEGARVHSIELRDATGHYVLEGSRVAQCSADSVSVNFSNVRKVWAGRF